MKCAACQDTGWQGIMKEATHSEAAPFIIRGPLPLLVARSAGHFGMFASAT
jgi:hypothetical protein